jgi:hypothetical protein
LALAALALDVQLDGLLATIQPDKVASLAAHRTVVVAGEITAARPLYLDHPGAEVGELAGGEGRSDRLLKRDHEDTIEGQHAWHYDRATPYRPAGR